MLQAGVGPDGPIVCERARTRLLGGVALRALAPALAAAALGVSLAQTAHAGTVNPVQVTTYQLSAGNNPITLGAATHVDTSGGYGDAVDGNGSVDWTVTNQGYLKGYAGGIVLGSPSNVTNSGSIIGGASYLGDGVQLTQGGGVTNLAGGSIRSNSGSGVYLNAPGSVTNAGNVSGSTFGVGLGSGRTVNNTGNISGAAVGIEAFGPAMIANSGAVTSAGVGASVQLSAGGTITNQAGGYLGGGAVGALIQGAPGSVSNQGSITGTAYGVGLLAGGNVTNLAGGNITGYALAGNATFNQGGAAGVYARNMVATVTNAGTITGAGYGIFLAAGGNVTNGSGGTITGTGRSGFGPVGYNGDRNGAIGVLISGAAGTVTNTGSIYGIDYGVKLGAGGSVTNNLGGSISGQQGVRLSAGGTVTNTGTIYGIGGGPSTAYGVAAYNAPAVVTNSGNISGYQVYAVSLHAGGIVTNTHSGYLGGGVYITNGNGNVTNDGRIAGYYTGVRFGGYSNLPMTATLTNTGTITAGASYAGVLGYGAGATVAVTNAGSIGGLVGVYLEGNSTVTNAVGGNITGTNDGVRFGSHYGEAITGSVTNAGTITGTVTAVSTFNDGNATLSVYNQVGGLIKGGSFGVRAAGPTTITNAGLIIGGRYGVKAAGNATLTNAAGGTITFTGTSSIKHYAAVQVNGVGVVTNAGNISAGPGILGYGVRISSGTVTNSGNISAGGLADIAVFVQGAGAVTNAGTIIAGKGLGVAVVTGNVSNLKGGVISTYFDGVDVATGTVTNAGSISSVNAYGVGALKDGVIVNQAGGTITSGLFGVVGIVGNTTVANAARATISSTGNSTVFPSGFGFGVYVRSIGNITNAGTISAVGNMSVGVRLLGGGAVVNTGLISGGVDGVETLGAGFLGSTGGTVTNAGTISGGAASIVFLGNTTNVLTLETGSTLIGPAIGSTASAATNALILQGQGLANNAFLNFNTLAVNAGGVWALNGVSTIGATAINSGNLQVGDAAHTGAMLTGPVTVNAAGTLSGHGTVAGNVVDNGGTVSPGGTIGTLTISGNLTLNGASTLAIEVAPPSASSLLVVSGSANQAGTLELVTDPGVYRKGEQFHFLTAGAFTGSFSTLVATNGLPFGVTVSGSNEIATLLAGNFAATNGTPNQTAIGVAVNDIPLGAGDFDPVFNALVAIGPGAAQSRALDTLGGEIYADTLTVGRQATRGFLGTLDDRLEGADSGAAVASGNATGDPAIWGQVLGRFDRISGDGNAHGVTVNAGGLAFGVSGVWGSTTAGAALSWDETSPSLRGLPQSGRLDTTQIAAYGEERFGGMVYVNGAASVGFTNGHGERAIVFTGVSRHAFGDFNGTTVGLAANIGARMPMGEGRIAEPSVGVVYSSVHQGDVREAGAGSADLAVAGRTQAATASLVAIRFSNGLPLEEGLLSADVKIAWAHDFNGLTPTVAESFPVTPGAAFILSGANSGQDQAVFSGGLSLAASHQFSIFARYNAAVAHNDSEQAVDLGLKFRW
jgi:fibronectin-binding autotransporter adhesin